MRYITIKELEKMLITSRKDNAPQVRIMEARVENKYVVAELSNNIRIKFRNF